MRPPHTLHSCKNSEVDTTLRDLYAAMGRSVDAAAFGAKIEKVK
jgi:hypothetical protein